MKRLLAITAIAVICALAALAAFSGSARATYPGATNGRIAFGMNVNGNTDVVPSEGGTPQQLTSVGNNVYPAFSPDGGKIVFTSNRTSTSQVYVMNADGSGQTQLTFDAQPKDQVPDWSPDGSEIAYLADTHGISDVVNPSWGDIWVMNADGSDQHPITSGATYYGTAWSPDGSRIATLDFTANTRIVY